MKPLLLASILCLISSSARSQGGVDGYPFDTPADPRSVAMGESFVALPSNPAALMYNPAGLAGLHGVTLSYSRRSLNAVPAIDQYALHSLNGTLAVPFGVFGLQYNEKYLGSFLVTTSASPDGAGTETTFFSYDIALGFGTRICDRLALGVAAKYYDFVESATAPAYLFDAGLLYTLPPSHEQSAMQDSLSVGLSVQNVKIQSKTMIGGFQIQEYLPEYLRLGISYAFRAVPRDESDLATVSVLVTGEYRNLLNQETPLHRGRSFWGVGIDATLFEFLSLRAGAFIEPFTWFEGERDRPAFRYGAGLNLPLRRFGSTLPVVVSFNYSVVPLNQIVNTSLTGYTERSSLPAISLEVKYLTNIW